MNKAFKYLLRSHLFLAVCSFVFLFGLHYDYDFSSLYSLMISLGIVGVYNAHRLWKFKKNRLPFYMREWTSMNKKSLSFLAIIPTIIAMLLYYFLFSGQPAQNLLALVCVLISVFYVKRIGRTSLREIPYMKVVFVIMTWYLLFFIFPYMIFDAKEPWLLSFFFLLIILIPSDIKDVYYDHEEMRTIPQVAGLNHSIRIIQLIILISMFILLFEINEIPNASAWLIGFSYFFVLTVVYNKIGYKYFFVYADFTFMLIGGASIYLHYM